MTTTFKLRRDTAAAWTAANPTLADGEPGIETDTKKWKVGDGTTAWNSLGYFNQATVPAFATPAIVLGTAAASGSAGTVIRSDATLAAFDATAPTTQAIGDSAATGSAAVAARRDHTHGMPAFATPAIVLGSSAAAGSAATLIRSDGTIAAFDTTNPSTQAFSDAAAVGTAAFAARRDHKHAMPANPIPILYDYEVAGSDKASIDTNSDGAYAGALSTAWHVLEIWVYARTDEAAAQGNISMTFNNDTGNNYYRSLIQVANTTVTGIATTAAAAFNFACTGGGATASVFSVQRLTIFNYAGTVGYKAGEANGGSPDQTAANMRANIQQIGYASTTAISRVAITPLTGGGKLKVGTRMVIRAW